MGSRGDVQPYVALGKGLKAAGHGVRILAPENFEGLVRSHLLGFCSVRGNVQAFMGEPATRKLLESGNFLAIQAHTTKTSKLAAIHWAEDALAASLGMDLLIVGPLLQAYLFPFTPTRAFAAILYPRSLSKLGGAINRLSHQLLRQWMWQGTRAGDASARRQVLDLPTAPPPDWTQADITGHWFLEEAPDWTPAAALRAFLDRGEPPVFVGFGSMGSRDPAATTGLVLQAIERTGQRAILESGRRGLSHSDLPDTIHAVDAIPHDWLFPRLAAVVHHGGAGTTAAALRAGIPSVVVPFFGDQPYGGQCLAEAGVAPAPIPRKRLSAERLAEAVHTAVKDQAMRQRAAALGRKVRAEDGVARAVAIVAELLTDDGERQA